MVVPHDHYPPEFVREHQGIVVRAARQLRDTCIVVPSTRGRDILPGLSIASNNGAITSAGIAAAGRPY